MRYIDEDVYFSASDIANYLDCPHILTLDRGVLEKQMERPASDEYIRLIRCTSING
jgi:hypothetical protein